MILFLHTKNRLNILALTLLISGTANAQNIERPAIEVGDRWKYETKDTLTNLPTSQTERIVTALGNDRIEATENGSTAIYTAEWNPLDPLRSSFPCIQIPLGRGGQVAPRRQELEQGDRL